MPDTDEKSDEGSFDLISSGKFEREHPRFQGEYRSLAEYIGFSLCQKKIVSCTVTAGLPVLLVGLFLFLLSFFVVSLSSFFESAPPVVEQHYERTNQEGATSKDSHSPEKVTEETVKMSDD